MLYKHFLHQKVQDEISVDLMQMMNAREMRFYRQQDLLSKYQKPLLCFTMNIAGPIKQNTLIRKGFDLGIHAFKKQLLRVGGNILFETVIHDITGNEAYYVIDLDPYFLKSICCEIEDADSLGRLYDMDILYPDSKTESSIKKIDRQDLGLSERACIICGKSGKTCASRRIHPISEIQKKTTEILSNHILEYDQKKIAEFATRALLYEVSATPKPGLVDRRNSGSHKDMDFYSFINSSVSLLPYFKKCAAIGQRSILEGWSSRECFNQLRLPGKQAENNMLACTNGVNTHKGAIFTMGILAAASSRYLLKNTSQNLDINTDDILQECKEMTKGLICEDFKNITAENATTVGQKLYVTYEITGIRGQMEEGLPAVSKQGLPLLKSLLAKGKSIDQASTITLLSILGCADDTNMIHRGNREIQLQESRRATDLSQKLATFPSDQMDSFLKSMDDEYISRNLSPGGSADLLAACWFLYFIGEEYV